jgi:hypothetical protein
MDTPSRPACEDNSWLRSVGQAALRTLCCAAIVLASLLHFQPEPHVDLYPSYVAARLANEGRWEHIYHPSAWLHGGVDPEWDRRALAFGVDPEPGTAFVYHPWYLSALRPVVARVDYASFQALSVWLNKASIVFVGLGLGLLLRWRTLAGQLLATLLVAQASPTLSGIDLGQNVLPALAFSLAAALAWRGRAPLWLGGLFAALAWTCKPWCAMLVPLCFLLRGPRAGVLTSVGLAGAMIALPELVMPRALMRDYAALNVALTRVSVAGWNNLSVLSIFERSAQPDWSQHLMEWIPRQPSLALRCAALGVSAAVLALGAFLWWRTRPGPTCTAAAWLAFMLMPLGICWTHYFLFALPLACLTGLSDKSPLGLRAAGLALLTLVFAMATVYDVPRAELSSYFLQPLGFPWFRALPMALLAGLLAAALWLSPHAALEPEAPRKAECTRKRARRNGSRMRASR